MDHIAYLSSLHVCPEAIKWASGQPDLATAWANCPRGDWMLWLAATTGVDRKILTAAALDCAETVLPFVRLKDLAAVKNCIHVAREWIEGRATSEEVQATADAVARATYSCITSATAAIPTRAAAYAADATYYAAYTTYSDDYAAYSAHAVDYAAYSTYAAAHAAYAADEAADDDANADQQALLLETARLVRVRIPYTLIAERITT